MDGYLSSSESFRTENGHGAVCHMNSVLFDYYIYNVSFTVGEPFNIDYELIYREDWTQAIVEERDLKLNCNIHVYIEKCHRILDIKGVLKWFGLIQGFVVGILEMDDNFPITPQQKITQVLKDIKPLPYIVVHSQYLYKYKTLKTYESNIDELSNFELGSKTEYGTVKWRGVDNNDHLYYGFEQEKSSECGTCGTFFGQTLFQCNDGFGVIISARTIYESISLRPNKSLSLCSKDNVRYEEYGEDVEYIFKVLVINEESCDKLLMEAMLTSNKKLMLYLIKHYPQWINISKHSLIMVELKNMGLVDLLKEITDTCVLKGKDNKELLHFATDALKNDLFNLFLKIIEECSERDMIMDNGETFLTNIIKEDFSTKSIIMTIETNKFNTITPNNKNETPMNLVCNKMMIGVVEPLLLSIKNQASMVCTICMDRSVSTLFNCGHNSCKECAEKIVKCHLCSKIIISRGPMFLNNL